MIKERKFLAYWDCLGFEGIWDITTYERQRLLADLKNTTVTALVNLNALMLRARYNPQRNPEIWLFTATDTIRQEELMDVAKDNPQYLVDLIREKGSCLYHNTSQKQVIT
jgi:hypothetical protein